MDGTDRFQNKTPQPYRQRRNERVATEDPEIVGIPLIVRVGIVRVEPHAIRVVFEVEDVRIAIGVDCALSHLFHHHLITLMVVFYL